MDDNYLSVAQAAKILGVSDITLKRYLRENLLPSEKHNGAVRLTKEAVERYKSIQDRLNKR